MHLASVKENGGRKVRVELPGAKQYSGEAPEQALDRILQGWLRPFADYVKSGEPCGELTDRVAKHSDHPIRLTYQRRCQVVAINGELDTSNTIVSVITEGEESGAIVQSAVLLARETSGKGHEYSLWSWVSEDEFEQLLANDAVAKLQVALEECTIPHSTFDHAKIRTERRAGFNSFVSYSQQALAIGSSDAQHVHSTPCFSELR